jgi:hypothetical protein
MEGFSTVEEGVVEFLGGRRRCYDRFVELMKAR